MQHRAAAVLALGLLVQCAQAATCVLVNLHPGSAGAYLTATGPDTLAAQSAVATYGQASYFSCAEGASDVQVHDTGHAQLVPEQAVELSCQATNLFALAPAAAGSDLYALQWLGNGSAIASNKQRFILENLRWDGPVTAAFRPASAATWTEVAEITGYGQYAVLDSPLPASDISGQFAALEPVESRLIATTGLIGFSPEGNSEVGQLVVLLGSGNGQLGYFRGCDVAGSTCNTCGSGVSAELRPYEVVFIAIFAGLVLLCLLYVSIHCCCHRETQLFPAASAQLAPELKIELNPVPPAQAKAVYVLDTQCGIEAKQPTCTAASSSSVPTQSDPAPAAEPGPFSRTADEDHGSTGRDGQVDKLVEELRQLLGKEQSLVADESLFDHGYVSSDATRLAQLVTARYGIEAGSATVFEHSSLLALATWLSGQFNNKELQEEEYSRLHPNDYRLVSEPSSHYLALSTGLALCLQLLGLASLPAVSAIAVLPCWLLFGLIAEYESEEIALYLIPLLGVPLLVSHAVVVLLLRRLVGSVPPGSYEVWSWPFLKWWYGQLLLRCYHAAAGPLFQDSVFMVFWLRLLGADLGSGVRAFISDASCLELLSVGNKASIGSSVYCHDVWNGMLHIRPVIIGSGCSNSGVVLPSTVMEAGAHLMPNSSVCCATLGVGKWIGTPASPQVLATGVHSADNKGGAKCKCIELDTIGVSPEQPEPTQPAHDDHCGRLVWLSRQLLQGLGIVALGCYQAATALPSIYILLYMPSSTINSHFGLLIFGFTGIMLWVVVQTLLLVLLKWALIGRLRDGQECHVDSPLVVRMWFVDLMGEVLFFLIGFQGVNHDFLEIKYYYHQLFGCRISSTCFRLSKISAAISNLDLIHIEPGAFVSGATLSTSSTDGNLKRLHRVSIGRHCDIALRACVCGSVSDFSMVGSLTYLPRGEVVLSKHTAFGTPFSTYKIGFGDMRAKPNLPRKPWRASLTICLWTFCCIPILSCVACIPTYLLLWEYDSEALGFIIGGCNDESYTYLAESADLPIASCVELVADVFWSVVGLSDVRKTLERLVVYYYAFELRILVYVVLNILVKWCVVGKYRPSSNSAHDTDRHSALMLKNMCYMEFHYWTILSLVNRMRGTVGWVAMLRSLGSQIGQQTYCDTGWSQLDYDLVSIGEHCCVNADAHVIGHVFQYGTLQFDSVSIGDNCNIGSGAQVVPGHCLVDTTVTEPV